MLLLSSLLGAQEVIAPGTSGASTLQTETASEAPADDANGRSAHASAKADQYLAGASRVTSQVEERIWRLDRFAQPVAWARLFALWHDSGQRNQLQAKLKLPPATFDLDKELDCGRVEDPWLQRALQGISRRGETPTDRRKRMVAAATVLGILAPYGKGLGDCIVVEMQTKKRELNDSSGTLREAHEMLEPALAPLAEAAARLAKDERSFHRAVNLANMAIQLRSAKPLVGFIPVAYLRHPDVADDTVQNAFDSIKLDWDPIFVAELADVIFPGDTAPGISPQKQAAYLDYLEKTTSLALTDSSRRAGLCDLAAAGQKLVSRIYVSGAKDLLSAIQLCGLSAGPGNDLNREGSELRSIADYLAAANMTSDWDKRVRLRMHAAKMALDSDPVQAVEIVKGVPQIDRSMYQGSWRREAQDIALKAALRVYESGDLHTLEILFEKIPDTMRVAVQIGVAEKAYQRIAQREFAVAATRRAYRTLNDTGTDDPETLVAFINMAARALPHEEAAQAAADAMKWLNSLPHPEEGSQQKVMRSDHDVPPTLGRQLQPAQFVAAVAEVPVASSLLKDDRDGISVDLGLLRVFAGLLKVEREKKSRVSPPLATP